MVSPLKRTWAPCGQTPTIRTSIQHHTRLNLLGALCVSPGRRRIRLHVRSQWAVVNGDSVIGLLKHLLHQIAGPMVLVWDQHPIHRRRTVKQFLAHYPRLHVHEFPAGAPELNPSEGVWTQVKESTASTAPRDSEELSRYVLTGVARTRRSRKRLWACIFGSDLPWKR